jgi:hypothetical protein
MNQEMKEGMIITSYTCVVANKLGRPFQGGAFACGSHPGLKHLGCFVFPLRTKADLLLTLNGCNHETKPVATAIRLNFLF